MLYLLIKTYYPYSIQVALKIKIYWTHKSNFDKLPERCKENNI